MLMKKGTKKIRLVNTRGNEYYVYDLDEDIFGKKKRLYAKSEEELKVMIEKAAEDRKAELMKQKPQGKGLKEYVTFYFKNAVGNVPSVNIKRWITLFENAVYGSTVDRDMNEITEKMICDFYAQIIDRYPLDSINEIDEILRKTFTLANSMEVTDFDYSVIPAPKELMKNMGKQNEQTEYIAEESELETMLKFCLDDNCRKYKKNELVLTFALLTGFPIDEIAKLKGGDFDLSVPAVMFKDRQVAVDERTAEWLKRMSDEGKLVFDDTDKTVFPKIATVQLTINAIVKRCGLPKGITKKSLHKAYIVRQLEKGVSPDDLQKRFGYRSADNILKIRDDYEVLKMLS